MLEPARAQRWRGPPLFCPHVRSAVRAPRTQTFPSEKERPSERGVNPRSPGWAEARAQHAPEARAELLAVVAIHVGLAIVVEGRRGVVVPGLLGLLDGEGQVP